MIATGTLATHGRSLGWVGMILVDEDHRRRGFGTRLFEAVIRRGDERGVSLLGLDATNYGRPLYEKFGFSVRGGIRRWIRQGRSAPGPTGEREDERLTHAAATDDWPALLALDLDAHGTDRSRLLRHLATEPGARVRIHRHGGSVAGAGFYRLGRFASMIGPIVARAAGSAGMILYDLLSEHDHATPDRPVLIDVPDNPQFAAHLDRRGFAVQRELFRMTRPPTTDPVFDSPHVFAAAGFELG